MNQYTIREFAAMHDIKFYRLTGLLNTKSFRHIKKADTKKNGFRVSATYRESDLNLLLECIREKDSVSKWRESDEAPIDIVNYKSDFHQFQQFKKMQFTVKSLGIYG